MDDSSSRLQMFTQSFLNCFVKIAYRNGFAQLLRGSTKIVKTLASFKDMSSLPKAAVKEINVIGAQQMKSVKTSSAMRLATRESLEFQACDP